MSKCLFITGTGTDIGKTYVTGLIIKKLHENYINAAYYKAAMSGNETRLDGIKSTKNSEPPMVSLTIMALLMRNILSLPWAASAKPLKNTWTAYRHKNSV